jgi:hypothetical protein
MIYPTKILRENQSTPLYLPIQPKREKEKRGAKQPNIFTQGERKGTGIRHAFAVKGGIHPILLYSIPFYLFHSIYFILFILFYLFYSVYSILSG